MSLVESINSLLVELENKQANFQSVLDFIAENYDFTATAFKNGELENTAEQNQGSCRVFSFAKLNNLTKEQTLSLFAEHYQNVLDNPNEDAHQNIRQFMQNGWAGIQFDSEELLIVLK